MKLAGIPSSPALRQPTELDDSVITDGRIRLQRTRHGAISPSPRNEVWQLGGRKEAIGGAAHTGSRSADRQLPHRRPTPGSIRTFVTVRSHGALAVIPSERLMDRLFHGRDSSIGAADGPHPFSSRRAGRLRRRPQAWTPDRAGVPPLRNALFPHPDLAVCEPRTGCRIPGLPDLYTNRPRTSPRSAVHATRPGHRPCSCRGAGRPMSRCRRSQSKRRRRLPRCVPLR